MSEFKYFRTNCIHHFEPFWLEPIFRLYFMPPMINMGDNGSQIESGPSIIYRQSPIFLLSTKDYLKSI